MSRKQIIEELSQYFKIRELVCNHAYQKFGDNCWMFFTDEVLLTLLILRRDIFKAPIICNNYTSGGPFSQRGLRCNICEIPKERTFSNSVYLSAHNMGKAFDLNIKGYTIKQAIDKIEENKDLLPTPVRIELDNVNRLHIDIYSDTFELMKDRLVKVNYFKP